MAYASTAHASDFGLVRWVREVRINIQARLRRAAEYNTIVSELGALNDRELADLGIARSDITEIARTHVQGL